MYRRKTGLLTVKLCIAKKENKALMAQLETMSQNFVGETEKNHRVFDSGWLVFGLRDVLLLIKVQVKVKATLLHAMNAQKWE